MGASSGIVSATGSITILGSNAGPSASGLINTSAIGYGATVSGSSSAPVVSV